MREAAEDAETDQFNPAIAAASGADGEAPHFLCSSSSPLTLDATSSADALQVGKIKNKVLKLTGEVQALNIQLAQAQAAGKDTSDIESKISEEQYVPSRFFSMYMSMTISDATFSSFRTKLTTNIATDKASAGQPSKGVA